MFNFFSTQDFNEIYFDKGCRIFTFYGTYLDDQNLEIGNFYLHFQLLCYNVDDDFQTLPFNVPLLTKTGHEEVKVEFDHQIALEQPNSFGYFGFETKIPGLIQGTHDEVAFIVYAKYGFVF